MAKKDKKNLVGSWAFLIGVILAVIFAFLPKYLGIVWTLVVIGVIVGLLNIAVSEVQPFLLSGVALVIVAALGSQYFAISSWLGRLLENILNLFVPATIIVALRNLWVLGKA
ncbi:MAG: hypothetical protein QXE64_01995 [Candidatus Pacearchaeota archaeon]